MHRSCDEAGDSNDKIDLDIVKALIRAGADVNARDDVRKYSI